MGAAVRYSATLVIIVLFMAGCSAPAAQPLADDEKPQSTRTSRNTANGATSANTAQIDVKKYDFKVLETLEVRAPKTFADRPEAAKQLILNGTDNRSVIRVTTTFYVNQVNPVNSGLLPIGSPPFLPNPVPGGAPTMVATWAGGTLLASHRMPLFFTQVNPGLGYTQAGTPTPTIKWMPEYPTPVSFSIRGWGDLYAKVVVEEGRPKTISTLSGD